VTFLWEMILFDSVRSSTLTLGRNLSDGVLKIQFHGNVPSYLSRYYNLCEKDAFSSPHRSAPGTFTISMWFSNFINSVWV